MKKYVNFIFAGIALVLVGVIMVCIKNGNIVGFDNQVYSIVTNTTSGFLDNLFKVITFFGSTVCVVGIVALIVIFLKNKKIAGVILGSVAVSTVVNLVIKNIFRRPRPEVRKVVIEKSFSFPSGHTMGATALYGILIFFILKSNLDKRVKVGLAVVLGLLPICVAVSRIYLGAHFASDVIGGALVSSALLLVEVVLINKYYEKIK